jgi:hypothetical protein
MWMGAAPGALQGEAYSRQMSLMAAVRRGTVLVPFMPLRMRKIKKRAKLALWLASFGAHW